jgi:hypothetical protein
MAMSEQKRRYSDVLQLMSERTRTHIDAFTRALDPWHVYEGQEERKEVTRALLQDLERQQGDLDYLIRAESRD